MHDLQDGLQDMLSLHKEIRKLASPARAKSNAWFFKSGPGQYGEGDEFIGLSVPACRTIVKQFSHISLPQVQMLLNSPIHEKRLIALLILVAAYKAAEKKEDEETKKRIFNFYLENARRGRINNWDLVDSSAHIIVGGYLADKERSLLARLARSKNLWERRIAIVGSGQFIRNHDFKDTLALADLLLEDTHDLIHKATGWMLREVGKRDKKALERFLDEHAHHMPRTMLRYAIEKFDEEKKKFYMLKKDMMRKNNKK